MFTVINDIIDRDTVSQIRNILSQTSFVDGRSTVGKDGRSLKKNTQAKPADCQEVARIAMDPILQHPEFQKKAYLRNINVPSFARYTVYDRYDVHTDDPIMFKGSTVIRTDLAMTLFLSDPSEYKGGELCVFEGGPNEVRFKLEAGSLVIYPSNTRHCVRPVEAGVRYVMINWAQSIIRDHEQREILSLLHESQSNPDFDKIHTAYTKLVRMWADV